MMDDNFFYAHRRKKHYSLCTVVDKEQKKTEKKFTVQSSQPTITHNHSNQ